MTRIFGQFPFSKKKPSHRIGDFRVGLKPPEPEENFKLIVEHNKNVKLVKETLKFRFSQGATKKIANNGVSGIMTEIHCGTNRNIIVKTFRDGTSQVLENK